MPTLEDGRRRRRRRRFSRPSLSANGRKYVYLRPSALATTWTIRGTRGTRVRRKQLNTVRLSRSSFTVRSSLLLRFIVSLSLRRLSAGSSSPSLSLSLPLWPSLSSPAPGPVSSSTAQQRSLISTATYIPFPVR